MTMQSIASPLSAFADFGRASDEDGGRSYYAARAVQARTLADAAVSPAIRDIHLQMAKNYDIKSDDAAAGAVRPRLSLSQ